MFPTRKSGSSALRPLPLSCFFNTALSHHVVALQNGGAIDASLCLGAALNSYVAAYTRIQTYMLGNPFETEFDILLMGLMNNMGHCSASLKHKEGAMECWFQLQTMLQSSTQQHRLVPDERDFFEARSMLGILSLMQPAASA
jgi:hypothetical protein